ncbi:putative Mrr family endonuclease [Halosimplex carlsbadense 2-9-1]|uniref:Putative Mrr family endonuclease n=2 Tax=Halosimplex carlsbadense TaxID=171164 RepID=M0CK76_9EURY|nr:putative Mrr family endonuclease [Halosimplex carlsbadense 2-9-1]
MRLINGEKLSALMVEHSVGVNTHDEGYKIDKEFWAQFEKFDDELISSGDVPQADKLDVLNETLRGVAKGQQYGPEIVDHLVLETEEDWTRRQADYYALAAAALGFLEEKEGEYDGHRMRRWELTEDGQEYLEYLEEDSGRAEEFRQEHILDLRIFEIIVERIKDEKIDHDKIKELIRENTEVTGTTIGRRAGTIRSWLRDFDEVKMDDDGKTAYDYYEKDLSSTWGE